MPKRIKSKTKKAPKTNSLHMKGMPKHTTKQMTKMMGDGRHMAR